MNEQQEFTDQQNNSETSNEKDLQIRALSDTLTTNECNLLDLKNKNEELNLQIEFLRNDKKKKECLQLSVLNCQYIDPSKFSIEVPHDFDLSIMETIVQSFFPNAKIYVCNLEKRKSIFTDLFFFVSNTFFSLFKRKILPIHDNIESSSIDLYKNINTLELEPEAYNIYNHKPLYLYYDTSSSLKPKTYDLKEQQDIDKDIPPETYNEPEAYNSHDYEKYETIPNIKNCWHDMLRTTLSNQERKIWLVVYVSSSAHALKVPRCECANKQTSEQKCTILKGEKEIDMTCEYLEKVLPFIKIINIFEFYENNDVKEKISIETLLKSFIFENPLFKPEYVLFYVKLIRKVVNNDSIHPLCEKFFESNCIFDQHGSSLYDLYNSFVACYNYFIDPKQFITNTIKLNAPFSAIEKNKVFVKIGNMKNDFLNEFDEPRIPNRQLRPEPAIIPFQMSAWFNSSLSKPNIFNN